MRTVEHWVRTVGGWTLSRSYRVGTRGQAAKLAAKLLGELHTTSETYHRDVSGSDYCRSYRGTCHRRFKRGFQRGSATLHHPNTIIVPSVGQLGYW